jgi:hypothetical protein
MHTTHRPWASAWSGAGIRNTAKTHSNNSVFFMYLPTMLLIVTFSERHKTRDGRSKVRPNEEPCYFKKIPAPQTGT